MLVALMFERSFMPSGIALQNDIGRPKTCGCTPAWRICTAAERPCGPAPITATSRSMLIAPFPAATVAVCRPAHPTSSLGSLELGPSVEEAVIVDRPCPGLGGPQPGADGARAGAPRRGRV